MDDRLRVHFDPTGDLLDGALECELATFSHWYGNTAEEFDREYGPYEQQSAFVALTQDDQVVGICRLVTPGPSGLKSLVDATGEPWNLDLARSTAAASIDVSTSWDVATLGIRPGLTGPSGMRVAALYHGVILACLENGVSAIVAILDNRVRRMMSAMGLVLHTLPGASTAPYLGSKNSTPVYADFACFLATQRKLAPEAHRLVTLGIGLDGVAVPPRSSFRLTRPTSLPVSEPLPAAPSASATRR